MREYGLLAPVIAQLESWTAEDALQASRDWVKPGGSIGDPDNPFVQWESWCVELPRLQQRYEQGDPRALLQALGRCAVTGLPLPLWCRKAYLRSWRKVSHYKVRTLDEAFGYELKGTNLSRAREKFDLSLLVAIEVARELGKGSTVEVAIETVAEQRGISFSRARGWYYEFRHHPAVASYFPANSKNPGKD